MKVPKQVLIDQIIATAKMAGETNAILRDVKKSQHAKNRKTESDYRNTEVETAERLLDEI